MRTILPLVIACLFFVAGQTASSQPIAAHPYSKNDLGKARWMEGNWKGMDGTQPFYEIYQLVNDSTLAITSYEWNGTDSSNSSKAFVVWREGAYFLGDQLNWKMTAITEDAIFMVPHYKASNEIFWKRKDKDHWMAVLKSAKGEKLYQMERINHFK